MMESHLSAAITRIQEIESRLQMVCEPPAPPASPSAAPVTAAGLGLGGMPLPVGPGASAGNTPFPVALAQAGGSIHLQPLNGPRFAPYIEGLITKYATQNGLSPDLVRAVITQESDGNPREVSKAGAQGIMQLMPEEAQEFGVKDPFDPEQNIAAGTRMLAGLLRQFNGDLPLALAAYNAGAPTVKKYNGIPPYAETQNYVRRIMGMLGKP